jgi:phosphate transport system substrate-binding protein
MLVHSVLRLLLVHVVFVALSFSSVHAQAEEHTNVLHVVGSTTIEKGLLEPNRDRILAATGIELNLQCKGTGAGLLKLVNGIGDVSGASETLADSIKSAEASAEKDRYSITFPDNLIFTEIVHDPIVIIVNIKNSAIQRLSKQQLADIFTQKIVNWKSVGGNDQYITIFISPEGAATRALFQKIILDGEAYPKDRVQKGSIVMTVNSTAREIDNVAMVSDSIAAVSESAVRMSARKSEVRIVETPVIDRPLGLITVGKPSPKVQKLIDYLRSSVGRK